MSGKLLLLHLAQPEKYTIRLQITRSYARQLQALTIIPHSKRVTWKTRRIRAGLQNSGPSLRV